MLVRKSFVDLTNKERDAFLGALVELKSRPAGPGKGFSVYDQFIAIHAAVMDAESPLNGGIARNLGHDGPVFLPWHREFLLRIQKALSAVDESVVLPYWDWTARDATFERLFADDFLGATPATTAIQPVASGYFMSAAPTGSARPAWWPATATGWTLPADLQVANWGAALHRGVGGVTRLPTADEIEEVVRLGTYREFSSVLEAGAHRVPDPLPTHNDVHAWVGGHMVTAVSPFDPVFPLNHAYVDYLWDRWQRDGHQGADHYPKTQDWDGQAMSNAIPRNHLLGDPMYPWVGDAPGYAPGITEAHRFLPDTSAEPARYPSDVLDAANLVHDAAFNYRYEPPRVRFGTVKAILDQLMADWVAQRGHPARLDIKHRYRNFGWQSRDQLRDAVAHENFPLIDSDMIGNGRAESSNLIRILRGRLHHFPRMPHGGPYLDTAKIDVIAAWINAGCLTDTEPPPP